MKHNTQKDSQTCNSQTNHLSTKPFKVVYTIKTNQSQKIVSNNKKEEKEKAQKDHKSLVNKINLTKSKGNNTRVKLEDVLNAIYKEYQRKNGQWMIEFENQLLNDINFSFDPNSNSLKSLNEKSSELFLQELLWILFIEYYIKHKFNKETSLALVIDLFDQGFNYITEAKSIIQFYYSTVASISSGMNKKEMFDLLNKNSQYIINQKPNGFKLKKSKNDTSNGNTKETEVKSSLITYKEEMEFIATKNNMKRLDDLIRINDNDDSMPQDDKCLSTQCNASTTVEYQHWLSPHLMHIKEEDSESKEKQKDKEDNVDEYKYGNDYDIIPMYEQKKYLKVKELMQEIEDKCNNKETLTSLFSVPLTGTKHNQTTPSKCRFSPREEYPIDIVEGSIQKFNRSFSNPKLD